jgi:hypothetical protein
LSKLITRDIVASGRRLKDAGDLAARGIARCLCIEASFRFKLSLWGTGSLARRSLRPDEFKLKMVNGGML